MDNHFQIIFPKISGSQEDNQIFGCPHSFFGRRGHANFATLPKIVPKEEFFSKFLPFDPTGLLVSNYNVQRITVHGP